MNKLSRTVFFSLLFVVCASTLAYAAAYYEGDSGQDIAEIQKQLSVMGYNVGGADGCFGPMTVSAVKTFQRDRGLEADGVIGIETYRALMGRELQVSRDSSSSAARRIIQVALRMRGVPYYFGGTSPSGFDCSGYVRYVFAASGVYLPRTADAQYGVGQAVSYSRLQPGDLVFFSTYEEGPSHSGIYIGNGQFISATSSRGVVVDSLSSSYWANRYIGARRVL